MYLFFNGLNDFILFYLMVNEVYIFSQNWKPTSRNAFNFLLIFLVFVFIYLFIYSSIIIN